jgi:NADH:ubiquinone oxidoreductase subunit 2 (subunit N)
MTIIFIYLYIIACMILKTLVAMAQNKIKIFLAYSSIGHLLTFHEEP